MSEQATEQNESTILYKPLVHEGYWFEKGKQYIDDSFKNITTTSEKLEKFILWLWGIYTSIIGLGAGGLTAFAKVDIHWMGILAFLTPSILLLFAYWKATVSTSIVPEKFDPRSADEIKQAYKNTIQTKTNHIKVSKFFVITSCFLIPVLIFSATLLTKESKIEFQTYKVEIPDQLDKVKITINGDFPSNKDLLLYIYNVKDMSIVLYPVRFYTTQKGRVQTFIEVDKNKIKGELGVVLEIEEDKSTKKSYTKIIP